MEPTVRMSEPEPAPSPQEEEEEKAWSIIEID
jgi:hypothetical protein